MHIPCSRAAGQLVTPFKALTLHHTRGARRSIEESSDCMRMFRPKIYQCAQFICSQTGILGKLYHQRIVGLLDPPPFRKKKNFQFHFPDTFCPSSTISWSLSPTNQTLIASLRSNHGYFCSQGRRNRSAIVHPQEKPGTGNGAWKSFSVQSIKLGDVGRSLAAAH